MPPEHAGAPHGHKMEGAFYIWSDAEIQDTTGRGRFGRTPPLRDRARRKCPARSPGRVHRQEPLVHRRRASKISASRLEKSPADVMAALGRIRPALFAARAKRPRPHLDDKVLTAWNGLMIAAFARAARVMPDSPAASRFLAAAQRAARFIHDALWRRRRSTPAAALPRRRRRDRRVRGGLRLSHRSGCSNCFRPTATRHGSIGRRCCR